MQPPHFNRKALLSTFEAPPRQWRPALALACDVSLFLLGSAVALYGASVALKLVGTAVITVAIVRLFLIGHEACHGCFFRSSRANAILGRVAFLPSLTAFSLWEVGHNVAHHGFNNLKGRDQVWAPFSKAEFDALPPYRQRLERLYRSGFGWGAYYLVEMWWKKLFFASRREIGSSRRRYKVDSLLVAAAALLWLAGIAWVARETGQSLALLVTTAFLVPFLLWNGVIGFVVFLHHTNPHIAWFGNRHEWQRARAYMTATAGVRFPLGLDRAMHAIMEHHAHHLNPRISMFGLRAAEAKLREQYPQLCAYRLDGPSYRDVVRRCKLYDFTEHAWLDFAGRVTARVPLASTPPARTGA